MNHETSSFPSTRGSGRRAIAATATTGLVLLALSAVPARADKKEYLALSQQIAVLQGQIAEMDRANREAQRETKRIAELLVEQSALLKRLQQDQKLQEERMLVALKDSQDKVALLTERIASAPGAAGASPAGVGGSGAAAAAVIPPRDLYQQAYGDFARKNYDLAIQGFQEYLRLYRDTEFADNAQYWIGECLHAQSKYADAVGAYNQLLKDFPASDKVPDARYKKGVALEALGRRADAVVEYRFVVDRFPNAPAARLAREKLGM